MKKKLNKLSNGEKMVTLDTLYTAASTVKGRGAMKAFLKDLLTPSERIMLGRRIIIARLLLSGETYENITRRLGVGHDTINRIQKWLEDQLPGYEEAVERVEKEFNKREEKKLYYESTLYKLKKKYPMHFLLFPTPKRKK